MRRRCFFSFTTRTVKMQFLDRLRDAALDFAQNIHNPFIAEEIRADALGLQLMHNTSFVNGGPIGFWLPHCRPGFS
ncbi:MAG: hypothetical protein IPO07_15820 [Haliscomenobacter sp.]|nr:hypothetical protein [Haliscomenobacter sp.]MBK9490069.1 hypothetical protein [Haliscomenobacter sp.]